ncbi:DHA2 family multidrug resistance protein-like MFS transporter [Nocardioides zeae]|uniref:DHA2 family multidrug resistance protein-like MFS transporter n=1 Tax=Nocardioides zeae TaxID=1457234 RepID=A0ACC6IEX3_9ACTN|nr:MFS transporter [Nocardioides zeae]MDR6174914.1 DHA2 family multidrug resistance protein-like MFS transporter [Nocardioides zeae]MDR6209276.1 DHA2 family multidrug resistance protein-like MFS transporter [Nocardioides zeae]
MTTSIPTPRPATTRDPRRWAGLAVLSASLLVVVMDMTILNVALPALTADLRPTSVELLWIVDAYALVLAGLLVPASALADRFGRRRALVTGFTLFAVASLGALVATTPAHVIGVRVLLGVGGALIMPSTLSMIRALFSDPRERATALGVWGAMAALGGALGPVVGGLLLEHFSWHAAFLVNVPVMAVAIVAALLLLPESRSARPPRIDVAGVALSVVGMAGLVYAIKHLAKHGLDLQGGVTAVVATVALTLFVRRCLRTPEPMLEVRLFRGRAFSAGVLTALTTSVAMSALLLLGAQWLQLVEGFSPLEAGLALLPLAVGGLIGSPFAPAVAARIGARTVLAGGLAVAGTGFLVLGLAPGELHYPVLAVALLLVGIGMASLAVASAVIMAGAPTSKAGSAAAIEESSYEIGAVLGIAVLGSMASAVYRFGLDGSAYGLDAASGDVARESLAGALEVAEQHGSAALVADATAAFTEGLTWTGLAGGLLLLLAALVVHRLTPRDLDLADAAH